MASLLFHQLTENSLNRVISNRPQAVLLIGPAGAGKLTAARYLASKVLDLAKLEDLEKQPHLKTVVPTKGSIGIDEIRQILQFLQLKTAGHAQIRRVVIVEDADTMTIEAQNALLKTLEEPPQDTVVILTAGSKLGLRPTILSRVQKVEILPVSLSEAQNYLEKLTKDEVDIQKPYAISQGYVGIFMALINEDYEHELFKKITQAKELISETMFERLKEVDSLAKEKDDLPALLHCLRLILSTAASTSGDKKRALQIGRSLRAIYDSEAALKRNPNTKLLLTNLMLNL